MNFLNNLGSMLFEETPQTAPKADAPKTVTPTPTPIAPVSSVAVKPILSAEVSQTEASKVEAFVKILRDKLAAAPEVGTINSFMILFTSLADDIPDEAKRFRAALRALEKTEGISQFQLQSALEKMAQLLEHEGVKFDGQVAQQIAANVTNREQQIAKLNSDIEALEQQRDNLATELVGARNDVAVVQASFKAAATEIGQEITDSLNRLRIYSTATTTKA